MDSKKIITNEQPKIAVLLAAYNGENYIQDQIKSIINQVNVDVCIFINIDPSTDRTLEICQQLQKTYKNIFLIKNNNERFGSAGKNFYYLLKNIDVNKFDYIALSDQDDIWKPEKIIRGIQVLKKEKASCYSSDVECFWDDGIKENKIIKKSYPQKKYDYLFEPAGPGCTYIFSVNFSKHLIKNINSRLHLPFHHDWYIYAFARQNGFKWHIDSEANILYRQHSKNQVGANIGLNQKLKRLEILINKKFKEYVIEIFNALELCDNTRENILKGIYKNPWEYRRNKKEAFYLLIFKLFKWI